MLQVVQRLAGRLPTLSVGATVLTPGDVSRRRQGRPPERAQGARPNRRRQSPQRGGQSRNDATGRDPDVPSGRRPRHGGATRTRPAERTRARIAVARGQPRVREGCTAIQEDNPRRNRSRCITSPAATRSTCPTTSSSPSAADTIPAAGEEAGVPLQKRAHRQSRGLEASPLGGGSSDWRARAYPPRRPRAVPSSITRTRGWRSNRETPSARRTPRRLA
jgi:hypothetical protein